jgi:hypothetical protein
MSYVSISNYSVNIFTDSFEIRYETLPLKVTEQAHKGSLVCIKAISGLLNEGHKPSKHFVKIRHRRLQYFMSQYPFF